MTQRISLCAAAVAFALASGSAFATNGYFAHGYGTKNKALAGAGAALPQDAFLHRPHDRDEALGLSPPSQALYALALLLALWETFQVKMRLRTIVTPALVALIMALVAAMLVVAESYLL